MSESASQRGALIFLGSNGKTDKPQFNIAFLMPASNRQRREALISILTDIQSPKKEGGASLRNASHEGNEGILAAGMRTGITIVLVPHSGVVLIHAVVSSPTGNVVCQRLRGTIFHLVDGINAILCGCNSSSAAAILVCIGPGKVYIRKILVKGGHDRNRLAPSG